ncbi:peptidoglycan editing factor PgeF [Methylovirgula sp. 4M-Z18]|uniref:peptidoglycan editing factor PgeF n=1 Tax=Methylovirgula sp. 4M-Z18 TaxID=2293567 RepID=UPI000E2F1F7D|nr:peptidoglycan editing factor PgeF [Methylovirgula sp. 4M-Z18]RFB78380.1 peptidoglycan editing factor PgeF [Methylovirgula sp. 4M-Z18]
MLPVIKHDSLAAPGINHAFFTRRGGVSTGVYASLNGGAGSQDAPDSVAQNRALMAQHLGVKADHFLLPYLVHSPDCVAVDKPWIERPRADALASATPGLGLGVTGADCGISLFADKQAGVIGAAHSGWRGALTGVIEATIDAMVGLGAKRENIHGVLGPTIAAGSYEVGPEFIARFLEADTSNKSYFMASAKPDHAMFDLPAYIVARAKRTGIGAFINLNLDTYSNEEDFYSYRRMTHRKEADYGRLVAGIALI